MENRLLFECVIKGRPIVKKNTKQTFMSRGRRVTIYSPQFRQWENNACHEILRLKRTIKQIDFYCHAVFKFYFKNHQAEADVSNLNEGPCDVLEKMGVIQNDKLFRKITCEKFFESEDQRTQIEIWSE